MARGADTFKNSMANKQNLKILLLSRYGHLGSSSRLRSLQYLPYLAKEGIEVRVAALLDDEYVRNLYNGKRKQWGRIAGAYLSRLKTLLRSSTFDLLWVEKELFPMLPAWGELMLHRLGIPYVVDYDDAVFHNYDRHSSRLVRVSLGKKIDSVMRNAAIVIAGNEYLADRAKRAGAKQVEILPTVIDSERYHDYSRQENGVFTIGWIGSPATAKYLQMVQPVLAEICSDGKSRMVLVGSGQVHLKSVPTEIRGWTEETEVSDINSFDVGIMPLTDGPWERGKCGYKLIQYMACNCPVVASPVGVNLQIVEHGANGFLVSTMDEWLNVLRTLRDDPVLRERMGRAGRNKVETQYCIQATAPRLAQLLRNAADHSN